MKLLICSADIAIDHNCRVTYSGHQKARKEWIECYIKFLQIAFKELQDRFDGRMRDLYDPDLEAKGLGPLPVQLEAGLRWRKEIESGIAALHAPHGWFYSKRMLKSDSDTNALFVCCKK